METSLPQHIQEFADVARHRFAILGGPQHCALPAETSDAPRQAAAVALDEIGALDLDVRSDPEDALAGAVMCRAAGATLLPYPVVEDLLAIEGVRLSLIDPRAARVDHGDLPGSWLLADLTPREGLMMGAMIVGLLWLGLYPQPVLNTFAPAIDNLQREAQMPTAALRR